MKHTPGPWYVVEEGTPISVLSSHRYGENDPEIICAVGVDLMKIEDEDECAANARLIAAAPDLLDALRGFLNPTGHTDACTANRAVGVPTCTKRCRQARAAIEKAEGVK